jgi:hypothetical protein
MDSFSRRARASLLALEDAGISPGAVDYINAHGTSTPLGDRAETIAIKRVFGDHAKRLAVSSTKSQLGHSLGASGGIELAVCALTLATGTIAPTINLDTPDPECDLDYTPRASHGTSLPPSSESDHEWHERRPSSRHASPSARRGRENPSGAVWRAPETQGTARHLPHRTQ